MPLAVSLDLLNSSGVDVRHPARRRFSLRICYKGGSRSPNAMLIRRQRRNGFGNPFHLAASERLTQVVFSPLKNALLVLREIFASAVDVKIQHRHRRLISCAFASFAPLGRTFQRQRNAMRICPFEDFRLKIKRIATLCDLGRPSATASL
jgi:hypothetical protein